MRFYFMVGRYAMLFCLDWTRVCFCIASFGFLRYHYSVGAPFFALLFNVHLAMTVHVP